MRILHCTFDPITQKELEYCLQYRKENGIKDVFIRVDQDGVLPYQKRLKLVERCIRPYRHIHLYTGNICGEEIPVSLKNEEDLKSKVALIITDIEMFLFMCTRQ